MTRKPISPQLHAAGACYGRFMCRTSLRHLLAVAVLVLAWSSLVDDLLPAEPAAVPGGAPLVQQMIWNPSPK